VFSPVAQVGRWGHRTLPVALPLRGSRFKRAGLGRTKDPFHRQHTNATVSQARSAFRRQIPLGPVPSLALRTRLLGRHWSLGFAAAVQLPTRIHSYRYELGPAPEPVIRRSERGRVPPIDFYSLWTPEHDHRCPNPAAFHATAEAAARWVTVPRRTLPTKPCQPRGNSAPLDTLLRPRRRPLTSPRIVPNLIVSLSTRCRSPVLIAVRKKQ
jgi:hypothetical protein